MSKNGDIIFYMKVNEILLKNECFFIAHVMFYKNRRLVVLQMQSEKLMPLPICVGFFKCPYCVQITGFILSCWLYAIPNIMLVSSK